MSSSPSLQDVGGSNHLRSRDLGSPESVDGDLGHQVAGATEHLCSPTHLHYSSILGVLRVRIATVTSPRSQLQSLVVAVLAEGLVVYSLLLPGTLQYASP